MVITTVIIENRRIVLMTPRTMRFASDVRKLYGDCRLCKVRVGLR